MEAASVVVVAGIVVVVGGIVVVGTAVAVVGVAGTDVVDWTPSLVSADAEHAEPTKTSVESTANHRIAASLD